MLDVDDVDAGKMKEIGCGAAIPSYWQIRSSAPICGSSVWVRYSTILYGCRCCSF